MDVRVGLCVCVRWVYHNAQKFSISVFFFDGLCVGFSEPLLLMGTRGGWREVRRRVCEFECLHASTRASGTRQRDWATSPVHLVESGAST